MVLGHQQAQSLKQSWTYCVHKFLGISDLKNNFYQWFKKLSQQNDVIQNEILQTAATSN